MAANRTTGVKKKQKYTVSFYLILLHCQKVINQTLQKMTNNKRYKLKLPKNN